MKRFPLLLLSLCLALPLAAQDKDNKFGVDAKLQAAVVAQEKALWDAWGKKDRKTFDDWLAPESVGVDMMAGPSFGKDKALEMVSSHNCTLNSYSFADERVTQITKDVVLLTYTATQDVKCGEQKAPGKVYASSLWRKAGGKWWNSFHQETPALAPPQDDTK